ncbi:hypothetical protein E3N88_44216 [Mikania micrantha]|uniref:NTF2-related export protein n=1 Tax=Mikania micrantha TaxID=192012 RepID=A0A5N6LCP1_9ASTR|nr:hypothetical protein E3N88_44216 [Mikania micrantha]
MDPDAVAKAFVEHYYSTFDTNRSNLANLYQESSMLTFEGQKIQGSANIVAKLTSLPFQQCKHSITTVDCQPSGPSGGMLVFVSGNLQLAGEQHALKFSQKQEAHNKQSQKLNLWIGSGLHELIWCGFDANVPSNAHTTVKLLCSE